MTDALSHRGPDDQGAWVDPGAGIALGHRRLSIIDLSAAGHQPMASADGRFWIVFNGEIYNFREIRDALEAEGAGPWRGHSDTEILLEAIARWGLHAALTRSVGMFALALWDRHSRSLSLARDRLGEKPLYYGWHKGSFLFGSELKAIRAYHGWSGSLDPKALSSYLHYGYVPSPHSIFVNAHKLPPAHCLTIRGEMLDSQPEAYWSAAGVTLRVCDVQIDRREEELANELEQLMRHAIAGQMIADVPLGAFLSGGIDSSTIVALMQAQSARPIRTFTIGFQEAEFNEARHAAEVAAHLGTDHTELQVTASDAIDVIPQLAGIYDEPFADSSQIPTILVSRLARRSVTVSLSGDGGDELFAGYGRYRNADTLWRHLHRIPPALRMASAFAIRQVGPSVLNLFGSLLDPLLSVDMRAGLFADRAYKAADVLTMPSPAAVHERLVARWPEPASVLRGYAEPPLHHRDLYGRHHSNIEAMMATDLITWLPDDVLAKIDRAAMSISLESRIPLLDHRVVEFAWQLPLSTKLTAQSGKRLLRTVLARHVPERLFDRPKKGFSMPVGEWLRGPLREWADPLLDEARILRDGIFDPKPIRHAWRQHLAGRRDLQLPLWTVLMFQAWLDATA
jgi:asparagine synthase (glutamine-hydrolysing)